MLNITIIYIVHAKIKRIAFDAAGYLLILLGIGLGWRHAAIWQISLAVALFFIALFIASMNRDRLSRLRGQSD